MNNLTLLLNIIIFAVVSLAMPGAVMAAPENGWDYLTWGMSVEEVQQAYTAQEGKAYEFVKSPLPNVPIGPDAVLDNQAITGSFMSLDVIKKYSYVKINVGIFYKGKLIGKKIEVNIALLEKIINDLKKKYPNGKISQVKDKFNPDLSLPVFEYNSEKIKVFTNIDGSQLYFYNAGVLDGIVRLGP
jgi:hypothetical protein